MPSFETDVVLDICVNEFYVEMSESEKEEMFETLKEHFGVENIPKSFAVNTHFDDEKWNEALINLINKRHLFSDEEMNFILKMADSV